MGPSWGRKAVHGRFGLQGWPPQTCFSLWRRRPGGATIVKPKARNLHPRAAGGRGTTSRTSRRRETSSAAGLCREDKPGARSACTASAAIIKHVGAGWGRDRLLRTVKLVPAGCWDTGSGRPVYAWGEKTGVLPEKTDLRVRIFSAAGVRLEYRLGSIRRFQTLPDGGPAHSLKDSRRDQANNQRDTGRGRRERKYHGRGLEAGKGRSKEKGLAG